MSNDIGIDLGTTTILAFQKGKGIVYNEPSVIAINAITGDTIAIGQKAYEMLGRAPKSVSVIKPLKDGVISDFSATEKILKNVIRKLCGRNIFAPRIMICVPSKVTEVEKNAVIDVAMQAGARKVFLIEEPVAAALGAGIDIFQKKGHMVIDIGGGTTDIAVISEGISIVKSSIKIAGNAFDAEINKMLHRRFKLEVGEDILEKIKIQIGSCVPIHEVSSMVIGGKDSDSGFPKSIEITSMEIVDILEPLVRKISSEIKNVLEKTPPEFLEDIEAKGLLLTGGGSLLYGLDELIENYTGIKTNVAETPQQCVVLGTGLSLNNLDFIEKKKIYTNLDSNQ